MAKAMKKKAQPGSAKKRIGAKTTTKKTTGKKASSKKAPAKKAAGKKAAGKKVAAKKSAVKKSPGKKAPAKKAAAKKSPAKKVARKTSAGKKSAVKKGAVKKTALKKSPAAKASLKTSATKKSSARKLASKKPVVKKAVVKKAVARTSPARKPAVKTSAPGRTSARKPASKTPRGKAMTPDAAPPAAPPQVAAPRSDRKAPRPARARLEGRDGAKTPVSRKVTIRTAVSKPTSPRKQKGAPAEAPPDVGTVDQVGGDNVETMEQTDSPPAGDIVAAPLYAEMMSSAVAALEAIIDGQNEDAGANAQTFVDALAKAMSGGDDLTPDAFAKLVDDSDASPDVARWLKKLPAARDAEAFLDDGPSTPDED